MAILNGFDNLFKNGSELMLFQTAVFLGFQELAHAGFTTILHYKVGLKIGKFKMGSGEIWSTFLTDSMVL